MKKVFPIVPAANAPAITFGAAVLVFGKRRVVYLPTREGYSLLLSVAEPEKFLEALRQKA
ncbi:MAG: hypothetical protein M1438_18045 [Deltaproteobacteria bacterium]|nr:hypothetical protein [Deltaproteobacteria bacterium]